MAIHSLIERLFLSVVLGDVIIGLGSEVVENYDDLLSALEKYKPGDRVKLDFVRGGKVRHTQLTLAKSTP